MRSISSISVMISMLLINENGLKAACFPEGCYYDISIDKTKRIKCRDDGALTVLEFYGNNGCDFDYFDPSSSFASPVVNPCCEPDLGADCEDIYNCDYKNGQYCKAGKCTKDNTNTCTTNLGALKECWDNEGPNVCGNGCVCSGVPENKQGFCAPAPTAAIEDVTTEYSVTVINFSGDTIDVGIFQTNPSDSLFQGSFPVVFASEGISNQGQATFNWKEEWGLSWASGTYADCTVLKDGIIYSQTGNIINVSPTDTTNNGAKITYIQNGGDGVWSISSSPDSKLSNGLLLTTDDTFTNEDATDKCFTVCVTLSSNGNQNPVFVAPGIPNDEYEFEIKPTYYISRIANQNGETVSESSATIAYEIEFGGTNGNDIRLCINDKNQFQECEDLLLF